MRSKICSFFFQLLLFCLGFYATERFCHRQTGGFTLLKVASDHPFHPEWDSETPTGKNKIEIDRALNQPYHFYSYGGQSYVFLSEDGKTILKLFKHHHMRSFPWAEKLPLPSSLKHLLRMQQGKLPRFFGSCTLAYDLFKDRTGLLYLHLNKTSHLKRSLTLIDKLNIAHQIDLDTIDFALQRKAEMPYERFRRLKKEKNLKAAAASLDSLLSLILERCHRGIEDKDPNIRRNCGFLGNTAIEIDLGSYTRNEALKNPHVAQETLLRQTAKLEQWILKTYPELYPHLQQQLDVLIKDLHQKN